MLKVWLGASPRPREEDEDLAGGGAFRRIPEPEIANFVQSTADQAQARLPCAALYPLTTKL
jgi:hypothetical protein